MKLLFEWDASKARSNLKKHGVTFEEATTIFGDPRAITIKSTVSSSEERMVTIGKTASGSVIIVVVHTDRNDRIRIISARPASKLERRQYIG
jgi:uncharacterized DUF497 family protein